MFEWLKRTMPRSLYGRAALILLVPVVTTQLVVSVVFIQRHYEDVTEQMTKSVLLDLRLLLSTVDAAPSREAAASAVAPLAAALEIEPDWAPGTPPGDTRWRWDLSGRVVIERLRQELPGVIGIDLADNLRRVPVVVETRYGPLRLTVSRGRVSASNPHQLLVLMVVTSLLMTVIAFLFLRNQLRPIRRLAHAAEAFGRGRSEPYRPAGALEVRAAGSAFLDMRNRIERQMEQRTLMLSGVSHDLRTPLTRLKLGLALVEDEEEAAPLLRDVADMQRLLDAFLDFAREDALDDPEMVEPRALAADVVDQARRAGQAAHLAGADAGEVVLRPMAVRRALENLVGNAVRYGTRAQVSVALSERMVRFTVEDDGPGIPPERREEALKPFARLDLARNQDRGSGVGLGLAIAFDIARSHGGTLRLTTSAALGGLRADLVLPR